MGRPASVTIQTIRNDNSSANITTAAYLQLDSALDGNSSAIQVNNSSTSSMQLAIGGAGTEAVILLIPASSVGPVIPCLLGQNYRLAVKALSANATTGELQINLLG